MCKKLPELAQSGVKGCRYFGACGSIASEKLTGRVIERVFVAKGYRGRDIKARGTSSSPVRSVVSSTRSSAN